MKPIPVLITRLCCVVFLLMLSRAEAVPYASTVTTNGSTVTFLLNESADDVQILFSGPSSTLDLGAQARGPVSFTLNGSASYKIAVTKSSSPTWTLISTNTNSLLQYFSPGGIAINQNPANLSLFGRIYIANNVEGTSTTYGTRTVGDGIYILNPDQTDALGRGTTASTAGISFISGNTADGQKSPFKIEVGQDNFLYIGDFSVAGGTIYRTDPDVTTSDVVLSGVGATANPTVHTTCNGSPIARGSTNNGNLTLWAIDGEWSASKNKLLRWDIGTNSLPFNGAPTQLGTAGVPTVSDVQADLDIGPDGKFFLCQNRAAGTSNVYNPDQVNIRVYDTDGTTLLWDSFQQSINANLGTDVFALARSVKVSPDGKKVAVGRSDTQVWIINLTNGVPDITQRLLLNVIGSTTSSSANRREVSFDAAGNLYVGNNSFEIVRIWSPGGTTTATTGSDGTFLITTPPTTVTVTNAGGSIIEGGANGAFVISRTGDTSGALTVNYTMSGTASNGVDYSALSGSVTFSPGAASTNIAVAPIDDAIVESTETIILSLAGGTNYGIGTPAASTISLLDNETPQVSLAVTQPILLESFSGGKATFQVSRQGLLSSALTVNLAYSGTANGSRYSAPATVNIATNATTATFSITPINNTNVDGNQTIICTITNGTGYTVATNASATATIIDDDLPPAQVLFSDNFDVDSSAAWTVNYSDAGADSHVVFAYDYSADGIPVAPSTVGNSTKGLKFRANEFASNIVSVCASPTGQNFTGDYRVRYDMWINYNGPLPTGGTGSTQSLLSGVGTTGDHPQMPGSGLSDGGWFYITGDGGNAAATGDYNAYGGPTLFADISGSYAAGTNNGPRDNFNTFYAPWGSIPAPAAQLTIYTNQTGLTPVGSFGLSWHTVAITKIGEVVTWSIDGMTLATITNGTTSFTTTGNIFLGYMDPFASVANNTNAIFGLIDNLRVESLTIPPSITSIQVVGNNLQINFSGSTSDSATSFTLVGSAIASTSSASYTSEAGASITQLSPGLFQGTVPMSTTTRFYLIKK